MSDIQLLGAAIICNTLLLCYVEWIGRRRVESLRRDFVAHLRRHEGGE